MGTDDYIPICEISTHTPHARCDVTQKAQDRIVDISTHAPHARCDATSTVGGTNDFISTHAPHARCDINDQAEAEREANFYSRTPCEVRLVLLRLLMLSMDWVISMTSQNLWDKSGVA